MSTVETTIASDPVTGPVSDPVSGSGLGAAGGGAARHWETLVSTALLGTDRRDPPPPPPGALADLAADLPAPTPSQRLLQQVAGLAAARRAGVLPGPTIAPLDPAPIDPRPVTPPAATSTWRRIVADWPVLEDEWLLTVVEHGWRVAPELVVPLLGRHRSDATRHARALLAAGPLGAWMIRLSPRLGPASRSRPSPEAVVSLPELAVVPELAHLRAAPAATVATDLAARVERGAFGPAHRAVLTNLVARLAPESLRPLADALDRVDPSSPSIGLAFALADLARLRAQALAELPHVTQEPA